MSNISDASIKTRLHRLGMTANYNGFRYIIQAVSLCLDDESKLRLITKCIYPEIAKANNTSDRCVERSIRTIIQKTWDENQQEFRELAGYNIKRKPTNAEFISMLLLHESQKQ